MNHNLQGFILFLFLLLIIIGGFSYLDYSMNKKRKENLEKKAKPPLHS